MIERLRWVLDQALDVMPTLFGVACAAILLWPCGACRVIMRSTVTYDECKRSCGEWPVADFRPGYHSLTIACTCHKPQRVYNAD